MGFSSILNPYISLQHWTSLLVCQYNSLYKIMATYIMYIYTRLLIIIIICTVYLIFGDGCTVSQLALAFIRSCCLCGMMQQTNAHCLVCHEEQNSIQSAVGAQVMITFHENVRRQLPLQNTRRQLLHVQQWYIGESLAKGGESICVTQSTIPGTALLFQVFLLSSFLSLTDAKTKLVDIQFFNWIHKALLS